MKKKIIGIIICTLLILVMIPFSVASIETVGKTITVDDDGEADYTNIQDAIDAASDGDTVFVYSGTYHEHINIKSKSIILQGETKETTIIDGGGTSDVIKITADIKITANGVTVSGFTIKNSGNNYWDEGVEICSHNNTLIFQGLLIVSLKIMKYQILQREQG
jgi:pectin methylesterase-like acyl-CoA thioesterase